MAKDLKEMLKLCKNKIWFLIFISICFLGCLYHVTKVTEVFLTFRTKVDVSIDTQSQIVIPMVTFCMPTYNMIKNSLWKERKLVKLYKKLTPAAIYNNTFDFDQVFIMSFKYT